MRAASRGAHSFIRACGKREGPPLTPRPLVVLFVIGDIVVVRQRRWSDFELPLFRSVAYPGVDVLRPEQSPPSFQSHVVAHLGIEVPHKGDQIRATAGNLVHAAVGFSDLKDREVLVELF